VKLTTHLHLVPRSKTERSYTSTPQYAFMAWCLVKKHRNNSAFTFYRDAVAIRKGGNVTVMACCSANTAYIPPLIIHKGLRYRNSFGGDSLPPGAAFEMIESDYITMDVFLMWLELSEEKCSWKVPPHL
jgi:hypothetical protein